MAAKKSSTKSKASPKKAAKKKAAKKKAAKAKATKKAAKPPAKKAAKAVKKAATSAKKKVSESAPETGAAKPVAATPKAEAPKRARTGSVSSTSVTLGHIFALKPRVDRSFRQSNLGEAKRNLADEGYADIREAARAVAEEVLEITRRGASGPLKPRR